jgi:hypothetical protein
MEPRCIDSPVPESWENNIPAARKNSAVNAVFLMLSPPLSNHIIEYFFKMVYYFVINKYVDI